MQKNQKAIALERRGPTVGTGLGETQRSRVDPHAKPLPTMNPGNPSSQSAARVFKWMLRTSHVPASFTASYIVPIPKSNDRGARFLACEDFRGISVASVLSTLFESCVLAIFGDLFRTSDHQFGFKSGLG
jgi:hypothetical protein